MYNCLILPTFTNVQSTLMYVRGPKVRNTLTFNERKPEFVSQCIQSPQLSETKAQITYKTVPQTAEW